MASRSDYYYYRPATQMILVQGHYPVTVTFKTMFPPSLKTVSSSASGHRSCCISCLSFVRPCDLDLWPLKGIAHYFLPISCGPQPLWYCYMVFRKGNIIIHSLVVCIVGLMSLVGLVNLTSSSSSSSSSHTRTVVRECCKGDETSQWRKPKFNPPPRSNPVSDRNTNQHR